MPPQEFDQVTHCVDPEKPDAGARYKSKIGFAGFNADGAKQDVGQGDLEWSVNDREFSRQRDRFRSVPGIQFGVDIVEVPFDRAFGDK